MLGQRCLRVVRERVDAMTGSDLVNALLELEERETGRIVTWGMDQNGKPYGLIESELVPRR